MRQKSKHIKEIKDQISALSQKYGVNTVFTTFLELVATTIAAQTDPVNKDKREAEYQKKAESLTPEVLDSYATMFANLFLAIRENEVDPCDILGSLFHELELHNEWAGQYFTPDHVSRLMADITFCMEDLENREYPITINEPTCGSGTMVIAAVRTLQNKHFDYKHKCFIVAQDIDIRCVWMTYIQMSMYGIPGVVIHGDTLSMKEWDYWYTPTAAVPFAFSKKVESSVS